MRIGYPEIGLAATYGRTELKVYTQPRVAILATGDEIVERWSRPCHCSIRSAIRTPGRWLRKSARAGGSSSAAAGRTRSRSKRLANLITRGLDEGRSAITLQVASLRAEYDLVEQVLAELRR